MKLARLGEGVEFGTELRARDQVLRTLSESPTRGDFDTVPERRGGRAGETGSLADRSSRTRVTTRSVIRPAGARSRVRVLEGAQSSASGYASRCNNERSRSEGEAVVRGPYVPVGGVIPA